MNYKFPNITHIDQVREVVKNRPEFIEKLDNGIIFIDYIYSTQDTFPPVTDESTAILRECRGIAFEANTGKIVSRPLHKFFNVGEKTETKLEKLIELGDPIFAVKVDGSMVRPILVNGDIKFATRKGFTEQGQMATDLLKSWSEDPYLELTLNCLINNQTPIFEFVSPENRIVIGYDKPNLILLQIRDNITGEYIDHPFLQRFNKKNPYEYLKTVPKITGIEGYVLDFNGHKVKIKTDEYLKFHRAKDSAKCEKDLVKVFAEGSIDDLLQMLDEKTRLEVDEMYIKFCEGITDTSGLMWTLLHTKPGIKDWEMPYYDQKSFALAVKEKLPDNRMHPIAFLARKKNISYGQALLEYIAVNATTQSKVDEMRTLWNGHRFGKILLDNEV